MLKYTAFIPPQFEEIGGRVFCAAPPEVALTVGRRKPTLITLLLAAGRLAIAPKELAAEVAEKPRGLIDFETCSILLAVPAPSLGASFSLMDCPDNLPTNKKEKLASNTIIDFVMFFMILY
jgi:hypothetical protein